METFVSFKKENIAFIIENKAAAIWLIRLYIFRIYRFTKGKHMERLLDNRSEKEVEPKTLLSVNRIDDTLIFEFSAYDSSLNSFSNIDNDELYNGDVVEVFLDLGDEFYYEFEVAPNGASFVAKIVNGTPVFINNDFFAPSSSIKDNSYFVTMKIDLSELGNNKKIRYNAFRIETKRIETNYILEALSPTLSNTFHVRDKFIELN